MTDDLVRRLRNPQSERELAEAVAKAADTIYRLEQEAATARDVHHRTFIIACGHQDRATSAEASRDAALKRLSEIHDKAMEACSEWHASTRNAQARQAYALALHDIATLAKAPTP